MKKFLALPCLIDLLGFAGLLLMGRYCRKLIELHYYGQALLMLYLILIWTVLFLLFLRNLRRA